MQKKKLLLAGSHAATTASSVVEEIQRQNLDWKLYWIGRKWATEEKKSTSLEYKILPKLGVEFFSVEPGKIENKFTRHTISSFLKIPVGFIQTRFLISKIKPDAILSFGGAAGAQVAFWGWIFKTPVIIHEQTSAAGRANIVSAKFSKKIAISRESSIKYFPIKKIVLTGDPISKDIIKLSKIKPRPEVRTIFVTGGSRGSKWINEAIIPIIPKLSRSYNIIFQTGEVSRFKYRVSGIKCQVVGQVGPKLYAKFLKKADIVISRAGSNTVSELIITKKPCIFIPIPWSYKDEQTKNAKQAQKLGLARIINQSELTPQKLEGEIQNLIVDYPKIIKKTKNIVSPDLHGSKKLVAILRNYL